MHRMPDVVSRPPVARLASQHERWRAVLDTLRKLDRAQLSYGPQDVPVDLQRCAFRSVVSATPRRLPTVKDSP